MSLSQWELDNENGDLEFDKQLVEVCIAAEELDMSLMRATRPYVYLSLLKYRIKEMETDAAMYKRILYPEPHQDGYGDGPSFDRMEDDLIELQIKLGCLRVKYENDKETLEVSGTLLPEK